MLTVLAVSVSATAAVRDSLKKQYYLQLAQIAGEAGTAYAKACLAANDNIPTWSNANPLKPSTDCTGATPALNVLVVAGGGGGSSGGGGGGGVIATTVAPTNGTKTVTVGAGGAGCSASDPATCTNGGNSVFDTKTAIGGGRGGRNDTAGSATSGGSGGGGGATSTVQTNGGVGTANQGTSGGSVTSATFASPYPTAGGGGAGGSGNNPVNSTTSGAGGIGVASSISGTSTYYGGGGGGATWATAIGASGGQGGGGAGGANGTAGTPNTGGGGGAGSNTGSGIGGNGGSGIVIVSFPTGSVSVNVPSGATMSVVGDKTIYTFTTVGTFNFNITSSGFNCPGDPKCYVMVNGNVRSSFSVGLPDTGPTATASVLIVGGGGGGGSRHGGGGGAGGLIYNASTTMTPNAYPIVVGGGGTGTASGASANADTATSGGNSSAFGLTALGGGAGRGTQPGIAGGSGGGGGVNNVGGSGTSGQGFGGGTGLFSTYYMGGGGGGAGGAGSSAAYPGNIEPPGGAGVSNSITGSLVTYAAGGKGSSYNVNTVGVVGAANTGNGGGAGGGDTNGGAGGGSGIVVVSYPTGTITATGGTISTVGNNTIHTFTSSGTFTVISNKARTIPNSGYVELTRQSNGAVWRTYQQVSVQAAVVPDLCSTETSSSSGWNSPVIRTTTNPIAGASPISTSAAAVNPGPVYFRKDFALTNAGSYDFNIYADDRAEIYLDGALLVTGSGPLTANKSLEVGCHTIYAKVVNEGITPSPLVFALTMTKTGTSIPALNTDTTWRVAAGDAVHFSSANYYEDKMTWAAPRVFGLWNNPGLPWGGGPAGWNTTSGDNLAQYITTVNSQSGTNYPGTSYAWFRSTQPFVLASAAQVKFSYYCDNICNIYMDGDLLSSANGSAGITSQTVSVPAGTHNFGVRLFNAADANVGAFIFAAVNVSSGTVLSRSDASWDTSNFWNSAANEYYSYDNSFVPTPNPVTSYTVKALVVGAGGSGGGGYEGGGGGAGGFLYNANKTVVAKSYPIIVGSGGAGGGTPSSNVGGNSVFDDMNAVGGGYGTGEPNGGSVYGANGGSGGGGSHGVPAGPTLVSPGIIGQGNAGGQGVTGSPYVGGGGGGAGAVGQNANTSKGGDGGAGLANPIVGSTVGQLSSGTYYLAGGGGGSFRAGTGGNGGLGGGAAGGATGANATANTGGGGGAGSSGSAVGPSGAGGSGVVVISYPTGSMTATGGTITTSGANTIHTFTSSGVFTVGTSTAPTGQIKDGLTFNLDAFTTSSYPGSGSTWKDLSGMQNDATIYNGPTFSAGSLVFNGTNQYATVVNPVVPIGISDYTVSAWVKRARNAASYEELISQWTSANSGNSFYFGFQDGSVRFTDSWQTITAAGANNISTWMNIVGVNSANGNNAYIYINGVLAATKGNRLTYTGSGTTLISRQGALTSEYFGGNISAFNIYNRALSAEEVLRNYNAFKGRYGL